MISEIKRLASDVEKNTKIDFCIYSQTGELLHGEEKQKISIPEVTEPIISDKTNDCTFFNIVYIDKKFIGKIKGAGESERAIAFLITTLLTKNRLETPKYTKTTFIKALLNGELEESEISKTVKKLKISNAPVCAMIIYSPVGRLTEVQEIVLGFSQDEADEIVPIDNKQCVLVKFVDESVKDYKSFSQYAEVLRRSIFEEYGIKVTIFVGGQCKFISELASSYQQALSVQGLAKTDDEGGVHSFKDYIVEKIIEDLPKEKIREYLDLLSRESSSEIFFDNEMNDTVEEFLENNLNASETSRKMFLHRNTLSYRLDKTEKETGLDVRKFSDAIAYRIISILLKTKGKI